MTLTLEPVTDANRATVLALQVAPGQERFVSSVGKLLIDQRHQREGHGREVVRLLVELLRANGGTELLTSHVPGDDGPAGFYARLGFVPTGELDPDGEVLLRLPAPA